MRLTDPIADLICRINNAQTAMLYSVSIPYSRKKLNIIHTLKEEGFISSYEEVTNEETGHKNIIVQLSYTKGKPVIRHFKRVSKPGRRIYTPISKLRKFNNGLGVILLNTSKGVLPDHAARQMNVGGEVICEIF